MLSDPSLLDLDFLVFSSHKTGTQTIRNSLRASGYRAVHCHQASHLELGDDGRGVIGRVFARHREPLDLITLSVSRSIAISSSFRVTDPGL